MHSLISQPFKHLTSYVDTTFLLSALQLGTVTKQNGFQVFGKEKLEDLIKQL